MQYNWIRSFHYAAKYLSISEAAKELNIVPSAISKQITELEKYHNVELFKRTSNKIELTHIGLGLKKITGKYFEQEKLITNYFSKIHNRGRRVINLGVGNVFFPKSILFDLKKAFPEVVFRVVNDNHANIKKMFLRHKFDIIVFYGNGQDIDLHSDNISRVYICDAMMGLIYSNKYLTHITPDMSFEDLASRYPFITQTQNSLTRRIFDNICMKKNIQPTLHFEMSTREGIIDMVRSGSGIGTIIGDIENTHYDDISYISLFDKGLARKLITTQMHISFYKHGISPEIIEKIIKKFCVPSVISC